MVSKDTVSYFDLPVLGRRKIIYDSVSWFAQLPSKRIEKKYQILYFLLQTV